MRSSFVCLFIFIYELFFAVCTMADIKLPDVLSDHMVLQQKSSVKLWGLASPGETISVKPEWSKHCRTAVADDSGRWCLSVRTPKAGGPYTIRFTGKNEIVLNDVMIGEVWLCSGQSNMEYRIRSMNPAAGFFLNEIKEISASELANIRFCPVSRALSEKREDTCSVSWKKADTSEIRNFSAAAYYFGKTLYQKLKVPVGLITSAWGGTPAQAWISDSTVKKDSLINGWYGGKPNTSKQWPNGASVLFNAMINPFINYRIKGVIWYQGEANVAGADRYSTLFPALIKSWRNEFGQKDMPFYYVQIAPYKYDEPETAAGYLREAQMEAMKIRNTGMAVTLDIGNVDNLHPVNKKDVGYRLALWALAKTYGVSVPSYSGPVFTRAAKEKKRMRLYFDYADGGLKAKDGVLQNFMLAGEDLKFYPADAKIKGNTVVVSSKEVGDPRYVRYAFGNADTASLFNGFGLPASSFRTDSIQFQPKQRKK